MTQRIFDIENKKDYADLWDILPDRINTIKLVKNDRYEDFIKEVVIGDDGTIIPQEIIAINWHDKVEITRPIMEATEADIGKICVFWNEDNVESYGILTNTRYVTNNTIVAYIKNGYDKFEHCRRLTKQEIEELC